MFGQCVLNELQKLDYFYTRAHLVHVGELCFNSVYCLLTCTHPYQESLVEVEEKYKKAMVSNAQLDNDKANLIYQVDTLKDVIEEMEEQTSEMKRELEEKSKVSQSNKSSEACYHVKSPVRNQSHADKDVKYLYMCG